MIICCKDCGRQFQFTENEKKRFDANGWQPPVRCPECRRTARKRREAAARASLDEAKRQKALENAKRFEAALSSVSTVPIDEIRPSDGSTLYVIGNGFDLMHKVESTYYDFRDSLGKNSKIRNVLDEHLTPDDIWADLETSLGQFDMELIAGDATVDTFLDLFDVYDGDSGAAEYFAAIDSATHPIVYISAELPRRFAAWVETLTVGTDDRPLRGLIGPGKVLCFNYTEFIEEMYGVPREDVCYIHGRRGGGKKAPRTKLILGHLPSSSAVCLDEHYSAVCEEFRQNMINSARGMILDRFFEHDEFLTKDCRRIIADHADFFDGLSNVENIITIGHSFYDVDRDYYSKIASVAANARWYFGCYGIGDLERAEKMTTALSIPKKNVRFFRTDKIKVKPKFFQAKR